MIVTAHPPGYLPGVSVVAKIARADAVVWLDDARFTMPGYVNRNQLPDGTWLAVPVDRFDHRTPIRDVTIAHDGGDWRAEHASALLRYSDADYFDSRFLRTLDGAWADPGEPLARLNIRLLDLILDDLALTAAGSQYRQSQIDSPPDGSLSTRLAKMVRAVGGTIYLSGPTPHLDAEIFEREGVALTTFTFAGSNPSVIDPLFRTGKLPAEPRQEVSAA